MHFILRMCRISNKKEKMASICSDLRALNQTEKQAYKMIQNVLNELDKKHYHHKPILLIFYFIKPMVHVNPFKQTVGNRTNRQSVAYAICTSIHLREKRMSGNLNDI